MTVQRAYLFLALCTLFWGGNAVAGKLAVGHVSPMLLTCLRWTFATAILAIIGHAQLRKDWAVMRPKLVLVAALGTFGFAAFNILFYAAAKHTAAINISIVQSGIPMVIFITNFLLFRLGVNAAQIFGFLLSLAGIALTASHGSLENLMALSINRGDGLMLIAIALYGGYAVALRFKPQVDWRSLMLVMALAAFCVTIPFAIGEYVSGSMIVPDSQGWLVVAYTAIFPAILAQVFFMGGVETIGANRAGIFVNLVPVMGTILSVLLLREHLYTYHVIALLLVLGGIYLAETAGRRSGEQV